MLTLHQFKGCIKENVSLKPLTTWRIGGIADYLVEPIDESDLIILMQEIQKQELPWFALGNGSNVLFSDNGFRGVIIHLGDAFKEIRINSTQIHVGAGVQLNILAQQAAKAGLTGLEMLAGIPGTVGGAAFVNAGAHGRSFLELCTEIVGVDQNGAFVNKRNIISRYRTGVFSDDLVITYLNLSLTLCNPIRIHELMNQYLERRRSTQPLSEASAGCTFKNPQLSGAGRLVDRLGLKGFQIGRAMISEKHANFIINTGNACANDVVKIIEHVRKRVWDEFSVRLDLEVIVLDEQGNHLNPGGDRT